MLKKKAKASNQKVDVVVVKHPSFPLSYLIEHISSLILISNISNWLEHQAEAPHSLLEQRSGVRERSVA